jgi:hypothetical protein
MMPILMFDLLDGILGVSGNDGFSVPGLKFDKNSEDLFISN